MGEAIAFVLIVALISGAFTFSVLMIMDLYFDTWMDRIEEKWKKLQERR